MYNSGPPHPNKTAAPVAYEGDWLRLELNNELYEGVRFGFLTVYATSRPWTITALRRVCQVRVHRPKHTHSRTCIHMHCYFHIITTYIYLNKSNTFLQIYSHKCMSKHTHAHTDAHRHTQTYIYIYMSMRFLLIFLSCIRKPRGMPQTHFR